MNGVKINESLKNIYEERGYWKSSTLLDRFNDSVLKYGGKEFVSDDRGMRLTYSQLNEKADALAAYLEKRGIGQEDVVSFQIPPRSEFVIALFACMKIGAIPAPLGLCFVDDELKGLLAMLGSRLHISTATYRATNRIEMISSVKASLPNLNGLIFVCDSDAERKALPRGADSLAEILASDGRPVKPSAANSNDIALILCTSGTTKGCKAVMYTHNNIIYSEEVFNETLGLTGDDAIFMPAPLSHATGLHHGIISPMLNGGRLVLEERFICSDAVMIMNREKCTYSMGATPFIYDLLKQLEESGDTLPHLRFYICGGAPVPKELVQRAWNEFGLLVCECYGSTESVPHVCVRPDECLENDGRSSGRTMGAIEVRVVDKNRNPVPPGVIGEEASRGPNVFVGYLNAPSLTDAVLDDDGWFYSGDLCVSDENGNIKIVGREKDIIVRGGENLNSNDINENLEGCPGIADHTIIGMPDERLGERICAFIVLSDITRTVTKEDIISYLQSKKIHKRHWPERVEIIDAIPRTESGKVKKNLLAEELEKRMKKER
ncbi:MAG: AMP-binding protein [Oscillospiraceae bacterium]|nr:AMP-binding protein [Oscillospiraceae bacterium]